jgi:acetyl-CoA/propionyl-CoA carboxylase, biotin carboxylase, biotin carboxyl carrier protein
VPEDLARRPDGTWHVREAGGTARIAHAVTDAQGAVWVHLDGEVVVVAPAERTRARRASSADGDLAAPMPAQVTAVLVEPGDEVAQGQVLLLLEAMKMELPLRAPFDARVQAVHCTAGERVAPGRALVELAALGVSA